jgi:DNA-binding LacI/PurR family transcriptional regulator
VSLAVWGAPGAGEPAGELANVTHVTWSREEMGRLAVLALEERVRAGRSERIVVRVPTRLTERGSVAAPRAGQEQGK